MCIGKIEKVSDFGKRLFSHWLDFQNRSLQ